MVDTGCISEVDSGVNKVGKGYSNSEISLNSDLERNPTVGLKSNSTDMTNINATSDRKVDFKKLTSVAFNKAIKEFNKTSNQELTSQTYSLKSYEDSSSVMISNKKIRPLDLDPLGSKTLALSFIEIFLINRKFLLLFLFDCIKIVVFLFILLFIYTKANAQTLEEQRLRSKSPWNFINDITLDTNAQNLNAIDNSSGATYTAGFRYSLGKKRNLWAFGRAAKRFSGEERFDLLDTIVRIEQVLDQKILSMAPRVRLEAVLPTNEFVHEQTSFVGALGTQFRLTKPLPYKLFLIWSNNLRWNFHNFRVSETGVPNIQTTASSLINLSYAVNPKIQTSLGLGWSLAKSYENNLTDFYSIDLNASYVFTNELSFVAGWTTAGSPFTADGRNTNIKLFDERDTTFYFSFTHFM